MGSVFLARDPVMERTVALKTILSVALASEQGSEFRERFYREARAAGSLAHPGIVPVFDAGEQEGVPFLVMEFVKGQTLADALRKGQRATLDRVCEIGQQLAEALGYAHRQGVIHRDIKPANILMTSREAYGSERPRITDFGVAKLVAGEITTTGQLLGTPAFMPPEQFTGQPIDGRTDLFSLGVIMYWMAVGEQPFSGETMTSVSYKVVHTEPIPPSKLNPSIPLRLERVILRCLAKNPAERYQTGEDVAQDLAALRVDTTSSNLRTAMPRTTMTDSDSEVTLDSHPSLPMPQQIPAADAAARTQSQQAIIAAPPHEKQGKSLTAAVSFGALMLAAVGAASWYGLHSRNQASPQQPAPTATAPTQAATSAPPLVQTTAQSSPPLGVGNKIAAVSAAVAPKVPAAPKPTPAPRSRLAVVKFDPKSLDPKLNGRLKIDLGNSQTGLAFTLEMDGQLYFTGISGNKASYGNLFVPPGVHEFRLTISGGGVQKASNVVSAEFKAKKSETLKTEIRNQSKGPAGNSPSVSTDAQVIATLKDSSRFSL